jgi:hypothetical protein
MAIMSKAAEMSSVVEMALTALINPVNVSSNTSIEYAEPSLTTGIGVLHDIPGYMINAATRLFAWMSS